jgi:NTE family protein
MRRCVAALVLLFLPCSLIAQERKETEKRPTIGVALEGGGALGLAHIGVLEWLDEHHIPVDYVAGTSMGGLLGGFYASGMSPQDLQTLIEGVHWNEILSGATPYEDLSYRRKEDQRAYPNTLVLGMKNGLSLPGGLNAGHQIGLLIDHQTLPYYDVKSFDDLPVPFRCVATDLVSGKEVVFRKGSLAEALRATMSIPGAFTPVYDHNKVYVDGGLVNNLPTDVVKDMGANLVIAVHLETQPVEAKDLHSFFNVLERSVRLAVAESEVRGMARADAIVSVPLSDYSTTDYQKNKEIIKKGYEAAAQKAALLEKFALGPGEWDAYVKEREARVRTLKPVPEFIEVEGTSGERKANIEHFLEPFKGKPLDTKRLDRALTRLTGVGVYDSLDYRVENHDGQQGLLILVREKDYAPPTLQPGFEVDGSESSDVNFTLASRLTFLDVAGFRSEWRTDFRFGNTYGVSSELYRPFTPTTQWFFSPSGSASSAAFKIYGKSDPAADYRLNRADLEMDLGYGFNRFSEVRFGYDVGFVDAKLRLGTPQFASVSGRTGAARMHFLFDHTDDPIIPRRGVRVETNFRWFDTSPNAGGAFPAMDLSLQYYQPVSRLGSVFATATGGSTFGFQQTGIPQFFLGGPATLAAYGTNELYGNQYYLFRAGYLHDLLTLPPFVGRRVYAIGAYEFAKVYGAQNESGFPTDFTAGVIAQTALGPLFMGGSVGDSGHRKWFFQLGRVF